MNDAELSKIKIGIAGLGLIGGSLAMAFKHKAGLFVAGFDNNPQTIEAAIKTGAVSTASLNVDVLFDADYIFVALYPEDIIAFIKTNAARFKKGSVVIDCCGVKAYIFDAVSDTAYTNGFYFIGGHPMAGTEKNGFSAANEELFIGASFILTPPTTIPENIINSLSELLILVGFKQIVITSPEHHDRMIAFTSQLPHILSCAYVSSPYCPEHKGFSAGSYRDVSRVANINPPLWAELFIDNKKALCEEIDILINNLLQLRAASADGDITRLTALLTKARTIKDGADLVE
jgi:prephenate dehydrogenase